MPLYTFTVTCISILIYNSYCEGLDIKYKETRLQMMGKYILYKFFNKWSLQANKPSLYSCVSTEIILPENTRRMYFWSFKSQKIPLQILLKIRYLSRGTYIRALEEEGSYCYSYLLFKKSFLCSYLTKKQGVRANMPSSFNLIKN